MSYCSRRAVCTVNKEATMPYGASTTDTHYWLHRVREEEGEEERLMPGS
jgi:hypothetical protein